MASLRRFLPGERGQQILTRGMQLALVGLLFIGLDRGNPGLLVNCGVSLLVIQLPAILERDFGLPMDPRLTLWLTAAAFFHAIGVVGIPGAGWSFYTQIWWWDHFTHSLSASVVAAAGYSSVRAVDLHSEEVYIPAKYTGILILIFVLAFGVLWELLEFGIAVAGDTFGTATFLTQYGVEDTLKDLTFNSMGGVIVAVWGWIYLSDFSEALGEKIAQRRA